MDRIGQANATAAATLVDEWIRCGLKHAVVAPGSRSTPLALAVVARDELDVHIVHDERVAAFVALGLGSVGGTVPAMLLCTSGTAAVNFHPAVVEAGLSDIPMLVCTADRPPELQGIGAPQTIDQINLYGRSVRSFINLPVPADADMTVWRPLAQQAFAATVTGPVQVNAPFSEPLVGQPKALDEPIQPIGSRPGPTAVSSVRFPAVLDRQRGVIIVGGRSAIDLDAVGRHADRLGWPILADPLSGLRAHRNAVGVFDAILRHDEFAQAHAPEVVVRVGRPPASKVLAQWVVASGAPVIQIGGPGVIDPDHNVAWFGTLDDLQMLTGAANTPWLSRWRHVGLTAEATIDEFVAEHPLSEPAVARRVASRLPADAQLFVSSSMPVRDLESFGGPSARALSNRGANGIDGVLSTGLGVALSGMPTAVLIGDIAFLHDSNALVAIGRRPVEMRIVVIDNNGGGIFSFLPQADVLDESRFEQLFGTPHDTDIIALAQAHGIEAVDVTTAEEFDRAFAFTGDPQVRIIRVKSNRAVNVKTHQTLHAQIHRHL